MEYFHSPFWDNRAFDILYKEGNTLRKLGGFFRGFLRRIGDLRRAGRSHGVLLHREAFPIGPPIWEWIVFKLLNTKVLYDFDDAIWLNTSSKFNWLPGLIKWPRKVGFISSNSRLVSVGNEFLYSYAISKNKNIRIFPTIVDTQYHKTENKDHGSRVIIGWTGTHSTLSYVEDILPVLRKLLDPGKVELIIISDTKPNFTEIPYHFIPYNRDTEISDLDQFDIGIMPLNYTDWAKGKCGFKLIQYMALEKANIANPVGVNATLLGNNERGLIANNLADWEKGLKELIFDKEKRSELGKKGRFYVEDNFSKKSNLILFKSILTETF